MSEFTTIKLVYPFPDGDIGVDDDQQNPLARALAPLMMEHKQLPSIRLVFLADENNRASHWLGLFVRSPGDKILFFPGHDVNLLRSRNGKWNHSL